MIAVGDDMQKVSNEYVESMKSIGRNRGYIRVTLGIVNSEAQENLETASDSSVAYFSSDSILHGQTVTQVYATCEQNFSKVNGNMYFLPTQGSSATIYPNGIVSNSLLGGIKFDFGNGESYDLVGFTIDFGENYPIDFTISGGGDSIPFTGNDSRYFTTELGLHGVDSFTITPTLMLGGDTRLRIYSISLGVSNVFTNENTLSYRETTYVSPLADSLPSTDISVTVENYDQYYNPDNPNSVLAFFEVGQEVKVQFGYDTLDDGVIEWLPETVTHLKTWQATDRDATFTATDVFDYVSGTYYGGKYYPQGISLYDLAEDIFADAGVERYRIDTSLEDVIVYNPMPAVDYTQALQIIANAGRCSLRESRDGMIYIESEYIPDIKDFTLTCNGQTDYSNVANLVSEDAKTSYAIYSKDFTKLNDSKMLFKGSQVDLTKVGYTSSAVCNSNGVFTTNPVITMTIGTDYSAPAMNIKFRNVAPQEFVIRTYFNNIGVETITVSDPDILFTTETGFAEFDTMEIEFTKGAPNSRITIDQIWFGSPTDYTLYRNMFYDSPTATRQERIKSISVSMFNYKDSAESIKDLVTSEIKNAESTEYTFTFNNPSYGFTASVTEGTASISIVKSSAYAITIALSNVSSTDVKIAIQGYEYSVDEQRYTATHSNTGVEKTWSNPLISDAEHAKMIEKWLSDYFLGDVEYEFNWRGDPRIDADDLLKLELKTGEIVPVKNYQNTLEFNGAWSGSMKARKVVAPTVEKSEVTPPTVTSSLTYNGNVQTATVSSYNPSLVEVTGITGTDAGTYTATLRLLNKNDYMWSDGTTANKQSSWTIAKANGNVTLSSTSVTLDNDHLTQTVTASNATGALSVSSSATSIATASISGNTITISNVNKTDGTATVTVSVASSTNYNATTKSISVTADYEEFVVPTWADGSDADIAKALEKHYAGQINLYDYWHVGDTRSVTLSAMPAYTRQGQSTETHAGQTVLFVLLNKGGKVLVNPVQGHETCAFVVGQWNTLREVGAMDSTDNINGWGDSIRREWCNETYKNSLPETFRNIFKLHENYVAINSTINNYHIVSDYFCLPSEKEITGQVVYSVPEAEYYNEQFEYYIDPSHQVKSAGGSYEKDAQYLTSSKAYSTSDTDIQKSYVFIHPRYIQGEWTPETGRIKNTTTMYIAPQGVI